MKYLSFAYIVFLIFFVGCTKDNPTESSIMSDSQLKSNIVGTWANDNLTITYDVNNNFQENIHFVLSDSSTSQSEIIKGTYNIKDGILFYNVSDWNILDTSAYPNGLFSSIPQYKIKFSNDRLYFYPLLVLTKLSGNDNDIWGNWRTTFWSLDYYRGNISPALLAEQQTIYKFEKDSSVVYYGTSLAGEPVDSAHFSSAKVQYSPPNLSWDYNNNKTIEFHNGQMYMFEKLNSALLPLTKVR